MNQPLVSIIIPTYNRAHLIGETLDSVLAQTYTNWECIVVDDGSTDTTSSILKMYCEKDIRFQYHHRPSDMPKGANACRNYGFELSKGEFVNWFDDDDVMLEDFVEKKIASVKSVTNIVFCSGVIVDNKLIGNKNLELKVKDYLFKDYVLWNFQVITNSVFFRKSFLIGKELFVYKIARGQETQLFSRLFFGLKKSEYKIINKPLFLYRQHVNTKTAIDKEKYNNLFMESKTIIAFENLERSIKVNDIELKRFLVKNLLIFFLKGIENGHKKNSKLILSTMSKFLYRSNFIFILKLQICGILLLILNRSSYRVEKFIIDYKIK